MSEPYKPILCLDYDATIHLYSGGWQDGSCYDKAVPGFFDWAFKAQKIFKLVIYSSRSKTPEGREAMRTWMAREIVIARYKAEDFDFTYADQKPAAFVTVDDRCIRFDGNWNDPALDPEELSKFRPWNYFSKGRTDT